MKNKTKNHLWRKAIGLIVSILLALPIIFLSNYLETPDPEKINLKIEEVDAPYGTSAYLLTSEPKNLDSGLNFDKFEIALPSDQKAIEATFEYENYNKKNVNLNVNEELKKNKNGETLDIYTISKDKLILEFHKLNISAFSFIFKFNFTFDSEVTEPEFSCKTFSKENVNLSPKEIPCTVVSELPKATKPKDPPSGEFKISHDTLKDGSVGPEIVEIPASDKIKSFAMCRHEITFEEYDSFIKAINEDNPDDNAIKQEKPNDAGWGRGKQPVINVSWDDAKNYVEWLSEQTGEFYDLPSEAQWEYVTKKDDTRTQKQANYNSDQTSLVGKFQQNSLKLYDTVGNVWEWLDDPINNEGAHEEVRFKVLRGCSWIDEAKTCQAQNSKEVHILTSDKLSGFRCIRYSKVDNSRYISRRLRDCKRHLEAKRFDSMDGKGGNAFKCYNDNHLKKKNLNEKQARDVKNGLEKIHEHNLTKITTLLNDYKWKEAEKHFNFLRQKNIDSWHKLETDYVKQLEKHLKEKNWNDARWFSHYLRLMNSKSSKLAEMKRDYQQKIDEEKDKSYLIHLRILNPESVSDQNQKCTSRRNDKDGFQDCLKIGILGPEMKEISGDSFTMGDKNGEDPDEKLEQYVTINKDFAMCRYEVTFEEYDQFVFTTTPNQQDLPKDEGWGRGKRPVINVSWDDAIAYVKWLKDQTGENYGLPSEAQWEYAARERKNTNYYQKREQANYKGTKGKDKWKDSSPVGKFDPNPFGLFDMVGNVWEWVADSYHDSYQKAPNNGDPWKEEDDGGYKILRGGAWFNEYDRRKYRNHHGKRKSFARVTNRYEQTKTHHDHHVGFRCSLTPE